jgi:hypothetical protein
MLSAPEAEEAMVTAVQAHQQAVQAPEEAHISRDLYQGILQAQTFM